MYKEMVTLYLYVPTFIKLYYKCAIAFNVNDGQECSVETLFQ